MGLASPKCRSERPFRGAWVGKTHARRSMEQRYSASPARWGVPSGGHGGRHWRPLVLVWGLKCLAQASLLAVSVSTTAWVWVSGPSVSSVAALLATHRPLPSIDPPKAITFPSTFCDSPLRCQSCCAVYIRVQDRSYFDSNRRDTVDSNDIVQRSRIEQLF